MYFWRNNTGEEVDVVIELGEKLLPIEIKSSQTFHADFLNGLTKWVRYAGNAATPAHLVYGGENTMFRNPDPVREDFVFFGKSMAQN